MLGKLYAIKPPAWSLLAGLLILAVVSAVARATGIVPSKLFLYAVQPAMALSVAGLALYLTHGQPDRIRHRSEKAFMVGSILSIWFVLYFLSGLITTYVHNSLVPNPKSILINLWVFGAVAFAVEYSRHSLMLLINRRNVVWFGVIVALVVALQQMNFGLIPQTHGLDGFVKLGISDFVPAIFSSFLLTYLALSGGLPAMLVFRLGLTAATILPPIIPKFDWYLQGVSLMLLTVVAYLAIDGTRQDKPVPALHHFRAQTRRAYNLMTVALVIGLAFFMTGVFTYKPSAIASNSMKPTFSRGSIVIVQKIHDPMDVRVGDIIQYVRRNETITHRVVAIDAAADGSGGRVFITKGDNNPSKDPLVAESQLVGIVRARIPFIGYPTVWLRQASGPGTVQP